MWVRGILHLRVLLYQIKSGLGRSIHNCVELMDLKLLLCLVAEIGVQKIHIFKDYLVVINWMKGQMFAIMICWVLFGNIFNIFLQYLTPYPLSCLQGVEWVSEWLIQGWVFVGCGTIPLMGRWRWSNI